MQQPNEGGAPAPTTRLREPYVGQVIDGCLRSAQIDREEADGLDLSDHRYAAVIASAERWEQQAERLGGVVRRPETERRGPIGGPSAPANGMGR